jgi:hypothetical protein
MNRVYVIESRDKDGWHPMSVIVAIPGEMQSLMGKFAIMYPNAVHATRWRRLKRDEAKALLDAGCDLRAKEGCTGEIDWS